MWINFTKTFAVHTGVSRGLSSEDVRRMPKIMSDDLSKVRKNVRIGRMLADMLEDMSERMSDAVERMLQEMSGRMEKMCQTEC